MHDGWQRLTDQGQAFGVATVSLSRNVVDRAGPTEKKLHDRFALPRSVGCTKEDVLQKSFRKCPPLASHRFAGACYLVQLVLYDERPNDANCRSRTKDVIFGLSYQILAFTEFSMEASHQRFLVSWILKLCRPSWWPEPLSIALVKKQSTHPFLVKSAPHPNMGQVFDGFPWGLAIFITCIPPLANRV